MLGVLGDLVQDIVVRQLEPMRHASDTRSTIVHRRGGSAANVAAFAAPRHPTRFFGAVGDDPAGTALELELQSHGVDTCIQRHGETGTIVVLIDPSGERSMFPSRGASADIGPVPDADLAGVDLLHCPAYALAGGRSADSAMHAMQHVHANGGRVSMDASSTGLIQHLGVEAFMACLAKARPDFLFADRNECALLGLDKARHRLPGTTVIAHAGAEPTRIMPPDGEAFEVPVAPVDDIRDVSGAGDACAAGFLAAWLNSPGDLRAVCEAGHRLAARVLQCDGAREPEA